MILIIYMSSQTPISHSVWELGNLKVLSNHFAYASIVYIFSMRTTVFIKKVVETLYIFKLLQYNKINYNCSTNSHSLIARTYSSVKLIVMVRMLHCVQDCTASLKPQNSWHHPCAFKVALYSFKKNLSGTKQKAYSKQVNNKSFWIIK